MYDAWRQPRPCKCSLGRIGVVLSQASEAKPGVPLFVLGMDFSGQILRSQPRPRMTVLEGLVDDLYNIGAEVGGRAALDFASRIRGC
jgi:hypothetical protein